LQPPHSPPGPDAKPAAEVDETTVLLRAKLNRETARIPWAELQRLFARGVVVWVAPVLDLVDTAAAFSQDRTDLVPSEMAAGRIARVDPDQARAWLAQDAALWAVVVSPWVLVQEDRPPTAADEALRYH
jgi:hypothetical protein